MLVWVSGNFVCAQQGTIRVQLFSDSSAKFFFQTGATLAEKATLRIGFSRGFGRQGRHPYYSENSRVSPDGFVKFEGIPAGRYFLTLNCSGFPEFVVYDIRVKSDTFIDLKISYPPPCQYNVSMNYCPVCHSDKEVIPIIYGLATSNITGTDSSSPKAKTGGCIIRPCAPSWFCKRNGQSF